MSLRLKVFLFSALAIAGAAGAVAFGCEAYLVRQATQTSQQQSQTLATQFQHVMTQRGEEAARTVQSIADAEGTLRMALDLTRSQADPSIYANDARGLAKIYHLDYLELDASDGTLISSSDWAPASGYRNDWVAKGDDWQHRNAFLSRVALPNKVELGLLAVRAVRVGERNLYVIGGWRVDREFLRALAVPNGMRALLYRNLDQSFAPEALDGADGPIDQADAFAPMIESLQHDATAPAGAVPSPEKKSSEVFMATALPGRDGAPLGLLLIGDSQPEVAASVRFIRILGLGVAMAGILFSLLLAGWISSRVSRPVAQLAAAIGELQSGKMSAAAELRPRGETAPIAAALTKLAQQVFRDRERLVQRERVASRREMAQRFAREIKESVIPMHMAAEDLIDARQEGSGRFDDIFLECSTTMRAELDRLKNAAARLGEFGRAPRPRISLLSVNDLLRTALKVIEPQLHASGRPPVTPEVHLSDSEPTVEADAEILRGAFENLLLHLLDAMPAGGTLAVRTREKDAMAEIEVTAQGAKFTAEDCQRLFMPAGTTPEGMSGLGLATAHTVITDLGGRIGAETNQASGTTLHIELPAATGKRPRAAKPAAADAASTEPARVKAAEIVPSAVVTSGVTKETELSVQAAQGALTESAPVKAASSETTQAAEEVAVAAAAPDAPSQPAAVAAPAPAPAKDSVITRRGLTFTS
jgi:signal transduction histidine kinase